MNKKLLPVIFLVIAVVCFSVAAYFAITNFGEKTYKESIVESDIFQIGAPKAAKFTITVTAESSTENGAIKTSVHGYGYYKEINNNYSDVYFELEYMNQKLQLVLYNKKLVICGGYLNKCYKTSYEKLMSYYSTYRFNPEELKEISEEIKKVIEKYKDKLKEFKIIKKVKGDTVTYEIKITKEDIIKFAPILVEMYKEIIKELANKGYYGGYLSYYAKQLEALSKEEVASKLREALKNVTIEIYIKIVAKNKELKEFYIMFELEKENKSVKLTLDVVIEPMSEAEVEKIISEKYSELSKNAEELKIPSYVYSYAYA